MHEWPRQQGPNGPIASTRTAARATAAMGRCDAVLLGIVLAMIAAAIVLTTSAAMAQTSTTGAVQGVIQTPSGDPLAGATVVATSPSLQGTQTELTDDSGTYFLSSLPPGMYEISVYYADGTWTRKNVLVQLGKVASVNVEVDLDQAGGETIVIEGNAPIIDQGSTKTGVTITEDYTQRIPTGRTFQGVLDAASTSQDDLFGTSFGGSTSPENSYVIEGLNVTDPIYGGATALFQDAATTTNLPNEFIREVEVITGGYDAEYGRATGSVVNVLTKSGGNEFAGTVFMYFTPGFLSPNARVIEDEESVIARRDDLAYDVSTGAELGGPIIADRLWFHVGFNPVFTGLDVHRIIAVDEQEVGRTTFDRSRSSYLFNGKLSVAATPNHQGNVSVFGSPGQQNTFRRVNGRETANRLIVDDGALDLSAKWTSKFNDNKTQIDTVVGVHRSLFGETPVPGGEISQVTVDEGELNDFQRFEPGEVIPDMCLDGGCPVRDYNVGGLGFIETLTSDRLAGNAKVTQRVRALGQHQLKAGIDAEYIIFDRHTYYTGGLRYSYSPTRFEDVLIRGFYAQGEEEGDYEPMLDGVRVETSTRNLSWFAQDSWSLLPNLTFKAGVRWEQQKLFGAGGKEAFTIDNMWSPRLGAIYDWTAEGRSKVFGNWGRYYQAIPLYVNSEAFGGEIFGRYFYDIGNCTSTDVPAEVSCSGEAYSSRITGGDEQFVVPEVRGQYLDQIVAGVEYELFDDFKVGATYTRRDLQRIIEDVSADEGQTTIIANPGEAVSQADIDAVRAQAEQARAMGDAATADMLDLKAKSYEVVGQFDKPQRTYQALQLSASKRFSTDLMLQASYAYSTTVGNVAGLIQAEDGINGLTPNFGGLYDLLDAMSNQYGKLPQDRPHLLKLDGYYMREFERIGHFVFGASVRASSGVPYSARGTHPVQGDSVILPRGSAGRSEFVTRLDARITYGRKLTQQTTLEAFVDIFNVFNTKTELSVDETYTEDDVNPIVGGDMSDLAHLKSLDRGTRLETGAVAEKNANFGNPLAAQTPLEVRFGMRLTF